MRTAIVSDIHANRTAFAAVLKDLRETSPDLILHGGDLADSGSGAVEVLDRIRDLGWPGVLGNTDDMLAAPDSLEQFAAGAPQLAQLWAAIREIAAASRAALGEERIEWLRSLPRVRTYDDFVLVHASPESVWLAPGAEASDAELEKTFAPLGRAMVIYGHIHHPYVRGVSGMTVVNLGSVGLPYDGDRRASYVLLDDAEPTVRRVEYDIDCEIKALLESGMPHADWTAKMLESGRPQIP